MTAQKLESVRWYAGLNNAPIFAATYFGVTQLPRQVSYGIGHVGTWLAFRLMREGTGALVDNLRQIFPNYSSRELHRLALLVYRSYARDTIDFIRSLSMDRDTLAPLVHGFDRQVFDHVLARGKGALLVTGHLGNWELGSLVLRVLFDYPVTVVGRSEHSPTVNRLRHKMRDSVHVDSIDVRQGHDTALRIRRLLADNRIVAVLLDRHLGKDRVEVEFFGRRAWFLRTPALLAQLSGAPLVPAFITRQPDDRFVVSIDEPIYVDRNQDAAVAAHEATQRFARLLEAHIRRFPHLWYQFYRYWDEQPDRNHIAGATDQRGSLPAKAGSYESGRVERRVVDLNGPCLPPSLR